MKTLGDRIKYHRKRLGLTQEQLAERMGVSPQAVSKWEHNQSCPDITTLPMLASVFGVSVDELLGNKVHEAEIVDEKSAKKDWHWEWHYEGLVFPLCIMAIGGLLLLNHFMNYDVSWWTVVWTCGLAFVGLAGLGKKFSLFSTMLVLGGAYFLLSAYGIFAWKLSWSIVLPAALLLWGLSLLIDSVGAKKRKKKHMDACRKNRREFRCENGRIDCELSFGEHRVRAVTPLLLGGSIETNFGSFTVDLSGCAAAAPGCTLNVDNNFGHLTLLVPKRFAMRISGDDSFAANVNVEGAPNENAQELRILLDNSFGNLTISYIDE